MRTITFAFHINVKNKNKGGENMNDIKEIWEKALVYIRKNINSKVSYNIHISPAEAISCDDEYFVISVPFAINRNIITFRFQKLIETALEMVTGKKLILDIIVKEEEEIFKKTLSKNNDEFLKEEKKISDLSNSIKYEMSPKYTFDNFIVGSSNEFASAAAKTVSESPGHIYNPLFIYGNSGLGKTHLLHAIANKTKELHPEMNIIYITGEKFTSEFIKSIRTNKMQEFTENYRTPDVLLVDDVQFIESKEATQEEFFHTFNELFMNNRQIVLTSDRKPSDLTTLTDRLRTRFSQGLIIDISIPTYETRVAILQNKALEYGVNVSDDVLDYIADNVRSNVRELEGVLKSVISKSQFKEIPLTVDFVKETIGTITVTDKVKVTPQKIIEKTAFYYNITENDIMGKIKTKDIAVPRQVAMYLCRRMLGMSDTSIGKEFGKDRSTVSSNIDRIEQALKNGSSVESEINYIIKDIGSR